MELLFLRLNGGKLQLLRNKTVSSVVAVMCVYPRTSVIRLTLVGHRRSLRLSLFGVSCVKVN